MIYKYWWIRKFLDTVVCHYDVWHNFTSEESDALWFSYFAPFVIQDIMSTTKLVLSTGLRVPFIQKGLSNAHTPHFKVRWMQVPIDWWTFMFDSYYGNDVRMSNSQHSYMMKFIYLSIYQSIDLSIYLIKSSNTSPLYNAHLITHIKHFVALEVGQYPTLL